MAVSDKALRIGVNKDVAEVQKVAVARARLI